MIFCVGSINLDFIIKVSRLPKRGETVAGSKLTILPGGKGANQALASSRAGSEVKFIAAVGTDQNQDPALSNIMASDIDTSNIVLCESNTGLAFVSIDDYGENQIVVSQGANSNLLEEDVVLGLRQIKETDTLLIQQEVPVGTINKAMEIARKCNARIVLNTAPYSRDSINLVESASIIISNEVEFSNLFSDYYKNNSSVNENNLIDKLTMISDSSLKTFILTLGDKGLICKYPDGELRIPAYQVDVVDTVGAGDTFCGFFSALIDQGKTLEDSLTLASKAAALTCTKIGAQNAIPNFKDIF